MFPRSVKIGAHIFKLKLASTRELGSDSSADTDVEKNIIRVSRYATHSRRVELLLHECLHAMFSRHDFKDEETICTILGEAFTQFLADNPRFITEALKVLSGSKKS